LGEPLGADVEARRHVVAAEEIEVLGAMGECLDHGDTVDAASAPLPHPVAVETDDDGWAVVALLQARGDDADDAPVPVGAGDDDAPVACWIEAFLELRLGLKQRGA